MQDTPGAMLLASDAIRLQEIGLTAIPVIDVATAAGVMLDDRQPAIHAYFDTTTADLPEQMRTELTEWFNVMLNGSTTPPRRQPREPADHPGLPALGHARPHHLGRTRPHLAARDHRSDVRAVLPPSGNPRSTMGAGLRSILTLLKARKVLFINPIARIQTGSHERRDPAARARREDPRIAALAQPRLRRPDRPGHLPRPARRRTSQHAPDRPRRRPTPTRQAKHPPGRARPRPDQRLARLPQPSAGPPPPTRTSSSTTATPAAPRPSADAGSPWPPASPSTSCAKTASSTKPAPPAATSAASATCSASPSKEPCATCPTRHRRPRVARHRPVAVSSRTHDHNAVLREAQSVSPHR